MLSVIRLSGNQITLISPIKLEPQTQKDIKDLGKVAYIIAPNLFHYLYIQDCKNIYPQAKLLAVPGLASKQPELTIDRIFFQDEIDFN